MLEGLLKEFNISPFLTIEGCTVFYVPSELIDEFYRKTRSIDFILRYSVDCSAVTSKKWIFHVREL